MAFNLKTNPLPNLEACWNKIPTSERTVLYGILHTCLIAHKLGPNRPGSGGTEEECRRQFARLLPGEGRADEVDQLPWEIAYYMEVHLLKNPAAMPIDLLIEVKKKFWA